MDSDKFNSILKSILKKYKKYFLDTGNYTKNYNRLKNNIGDYLGPFEKILLQKCLCEEVINSRQFSNFPKDFKPNAETVKSELRRFYIEVFEEEEVSEEDFNNFYETYIKE